MGIGGKMKRYIWGFKNNVGEVSFTYAHSEEEAKSSLNYTQREDKTKIYEVDFDDLENLYPSWQRKD